MRRSKIRIIQGILLLIFTVSAGILIYDMLIVPNQNKEMTKHLKEEFPEKDTSSPGDIISPKEDNPKGENKPAREEQRVSSIDFPALQAAYPDIKGWLTIPDTDIDYPVLQSGEAKPDYYLKRNYRGEGDVNGSLFLQWNCDVFESQNLVVYGHNMNSGAMFGNLDRYTDPAYCRTYPDIFFQNAKGIEVYEILAVLKADISMFPFQQVNFEEPGSLENYIKQAKSQSLFDIGGTMTAGKQVLTLITCSYEWQEARTIVVAVKK